LWAEAPGLRIKVPGNKHESLRPHAGERVTLGIRPEALHIASGADPSDYVFNALVEVVEPLGNEILLDMRAGSHLMVARVDPATRVKLRDSVRLALDPERLHFFDPKTEAAI
jgi:multiple sugar transport system ATP-binding protein